MAQGTGGFGDPVPAPGGTPVADPVVDPAPAPVYTPAPTPAPQPQPEPAAVNTSEAEPMPAPATTGGRAEGLTFGLGISYILGGAEIDRPDGASLRIRMPSGLTFEPFVRLATHGQSTDDGDIENAQNEFFIGANARLPLKSRGKVDLVGQVGGGVGVFVSDPEGNDNNTTTTNFAIDYGLSLEYWYNPNWVLSFTARNQFVRYQGTSQQSTSTLDASDTDIGIIWDPVVEAAFHLFF
jgi:hypothetical protein